MKNLVIFLTSMLLFACGRDSVMDEAGDAADNVAAETADAIDEASDAANDE